MAKQRVDEPGGGGNQAGGNARAPAQHLEQATCLKCIHLFFPITLTAAYSRQTPLPVEAVTGGFLYKLGGGSYTIRILMYPACILHVSCMYFDVSRSDTSRYIEIQQDTFVSVSSAII